MINPKQKRSQATRAPYVGKVLIICEGECEETYLNSIKRMMEPNRKNQIEVKCTHGGTAQKVLDEALSLRNGQGWPNYQHHDHYVVFDCDAPPNISDVMREMEKADIGKLIFSNLSFEVWLLLHFRDPKSIKTKQTLKVALERCLEFEYKKDHASVAKVLKSGDVQEAIKRAKQIVLNHKEKNPLCQIKDMNPYTNVHELVEMLFNS